MFGLLGGLLGGGIARRAMAARPMARRGPLAGLLANRLRGGSGGVQQQSRGSGSPAAQAEPQQQQQQQEVEAPTEMEQPQQSPVQNGTSQQVQPRPFVQTASKGIEQQDAMNQKNLEGQPPQARTVTSELLEPGPAAPDQAPRLGADAMPQPESVVNQTSTSAPVVQPERKEFGSIPEVAMPGIEQKLEDTPPRHQFAQEDPNPTQPLQMSQSEYTGNAPPYRYQSAGSATAFAPQFSYRRR
jgi:hypothetical protein